MYICLLFPISLQANSLQSKINQTFQPNINRPYGLFFVEADNLKEEKEIFEATLKTYVHVHVQGLLN